MSRWFNVAGPYKPENHYMQMDSLAERLREPRVKMIIEPILSRQTLGDTPPDDRQYLIDLGVLRRDPVGGLAIANPIYREVIPRSLVQGTQDSLPRVR